MARRVRVAQKVDVPCYWTVAGCGTRHGLWKFPRPGLSRAASEFALARRHIRCEGIIKVLNSVGKPTGVWRVLCWFKPPQKMPGKGQQTKAAAHHRDDPG